MPIKITFKNTVFSKHFQRDLKKLDPIIRNKIKKELKNILSVNKDVKIKKLTDYPIADYRIRIGSYRLCFNYDSKRKKAVFTICRHRKDLY